MFSWNYTPLELTEEERSKRGEPKLNVRDKQWHDRPGKRTWKPWISLTVAPRNQHNRIFTMKRLGEGNCFDSSDSSLGFSCMCYFTFVKTFLPSAVDSVPAMLERFSYDLDTSLWRYTATRLANRTIPSPYCGFLWRDNEEAMFWCFIHWLIKQITITYRNHFQGHTKIALSTS